MAEKIKLDQVSTFVSINLCGFLDLYVGCLWLRVNVFAIYYFDSFSSIVMQFAIKSNISDRVEVFPWGWYLFLHSKLFLLYQPLKILYWSDLRFNIDVSTICFQSHTPTSSIPSKWAKYWRTVNAWPSNFFHIWTNRKRSRPCCETPTFQSGTVLKTSSLENTVRARMSQFPETH